MKKRVYVTIERVVDIEIPDNLVNEAEKSWQDCMDESGDIHSVFEQIAAFAEDDFIEGSGQGGKDFKILDMDEDYTYVIEDII